MQTQLIKLEREERDKERERERGRARERKDKDMSPWEWVISGAGLGAASSGVGQGSAGRGKGHGNLVREGIAEEAARGREQVESSRKPSAPSHLRAQPSSTTSRVSLGSSSAREHERSMVDLKVMHCRAAPVLCTCVLKT